MRIIPAALFLVIFLVLSIPLFLIEYIIGKFNKRAMVASSQRIVVGAFRVLLWICGVKYTVKGRENVPSDEAVLYISNHRSYFDIPIAYATVPTLTGFMAKKEIKKVPLLRIWMTFMQCLFLDRDDIKQGLKTILQGIEQVKDGYSVFIAPEGTRNQGEDMLPFKEGSFKISEKTGCAIIPVAITNTDEVFENHVPWVKSTRVIIEYGKPIYPKELSKEEVRFLGSYTQNIIKKMLDQNKSFI